MITRPDEYKHQNDSYAIVDNDNVRGGIFDVVDLTTNNINAIPIDKRKVRSAIVNGTDSKLYIYTGVTLDNTSWGTVGNWIAASGSEYVHPSGFTSQPVSALTGANVISQITVNSNGHVTGVTSRQLTAGDIGAATSSHTHSNATTSVAGFMSATDKTKLDGITAGAEPNQNAFGKVTVGGTDILATGESDGLILAAGSNITLTPNALTKSVTISSTGGSGAYSFGTIAVSGQTNVVADSTNDTLTLVAGNGIKLTTNSTGDSITITNSDADLITSIQTIYVTNLNMTAAAFKALFPTDKNLHGNILRFLFTSGSTYNIDMSSSDYRGIDLSEYYNGYIMFDTTSDWSRATINLVNGTSRYGFNISTSNLSFSIDSLIINFNTNLPFTAGVNASLIRHASYGNGGKNCQFSILYSIVTINAPYAGYVFAFTNDSGDMCEYSIVQTSVDVVTPNKWYLFNSGGWPIGTLNINIQESSTTSLSTFESTGYCSASGMSNRVFYRNSSSLIKEDITPINYNIQFFNGDL